MDELELKIGVPKEVTPPADKKIVVQNTMGTTDDPLFVSTHGDKNKKWINIKSGDVVSFDQKMYFLQNSWAVFVFPVVEIGA